MFRSSSAAASIPAPTGAESRAQLLEFLLRSVDVQSSAARGLEWLAEHAAVEQALIAVVEPASNRLIPVAEQGVAPAAVADFSVNIADDEHPLVAGLHSPEPLYFDGGTFRSPIDRSGFHALTLHTDELGALPHGIVGVLLVALAEPGLRPDVLWLADVLGQHIGRLQYRQALRGLPFGQERMLLYSIINAVPDPILLTDTDGKLIIANTLAERLFTAPDEASEGWRRAVSLNSMLFSAALSATAMERTEGPAARRELLLVDPIEGSDLLFELMSSRATDERQGTYVVSVLRNVTDLARAKEEIEESYRTLRIAQAEVRDERHRLALIIDSVADPILVTDEAGDIVLMNTPADRLFTASLDASEQAMRRVRANGAHLTSFVSSLLATSGEQRHRGEISLVDPKSGEPSPVEAIAGTILSEQGELTWVVTILHDLTEALEKARLYEQLKKGSEELEAKVQEATAELASQNELLRRQHLALEQASALKSQFLANMSHEFRTPLNAILGYTHMLLQGVSGEISDAQRRSLTRIDSNSRHLLALINDILDITRIEAGRMPLHLSTFKVQQLIGEVISELEPIIKRSSLRVSTRVPRNVPLLRSDRQKVKQILVNLLSNALKFTQQGTVTISVSYRAADRMMLISVIDTGIGIAPTDQSKVFEDFRQLDSSPARGYGGTGLGLSICRRLATMMGGAIELRSEAGRGSTFTLVLPARLRKR
ncbi:MAG TPA: ATP-binding protein [Vicinamibacterales bacterium]|nr:ATP-binding protein [Vicinamibacterales bacterium]